MNYTIVCYTTRNIIVRNVDIADWVKYKYDGGIICSLCCVFESSWYVRVLRRGIRGSNEVPGYLI